MSGESDTGLGRAVAALEAATLVAGDRLGSDPAWDLVYCDLVLALTTIQACAPDLPVTDAALEPFGPGDATGITPTPLAQEQACVGWVQVAAQVLREADLGARPGLTVAVTAVADARAVLREVAA